MRIDSVSNIDAGVQYLVRCSLDQLELKAQADPSRCGPEAAIEDDGSDLELAVTRIASPLIGNFNSHITAWKRGSLRKGSLSGAP